MTFLNVAAITVSTIGVGLSAAGAAGAFGGSVDKRNPTPEEIEAQAKAREVFALGRQIQNPLDRTVRQDIKYLSSPGAMQAGADFGSDTAMGMVQPRLAQASLGAAQSSGGPGSGRWASAEMAGGAGLDAARMGGNVQGRLQALQHAVGAREAFLTRRTRDLNTGLNMMTMGAGQSAMNRDARIQAQVNNNMATNQAMGQLGGSLIGLGMTGLSAAGAGIGSAAAGQSAITDLFGY